MKPVFLTSLGLMAALAAGSVQAADHGDGRYGHFRVGYSVGFNVSADFTNIGGSTPGPNPMAPLVNPGDKQQFDNGFVGMDNTGNVGNQTTFWGYTQDNQVQGGNLVFSSTANAVGLSSLDNDTELTHGIDFAYDYQLQKWDSGGWGLEFGFAFTPVDIVDRHPVSGDLITGTYSLNGGTPSPAPYTGNLTGPGYLLGSVGAFTTIANGATIGGSREIDASVFSFRLGPYLDYSLSDHVSLTLGGGLTLALVDSQFSFTEITSTVTSSTSTTTIGQDRSSDLLVGGYLSAQVTWWCRENMNIFGGVTYQNIGSFHQEASGRGARLNMGSTVFLTAGLGFSF